jgi:7-cyano-7-deazaguanine synthase in queuosine biosynthesis
MSRHLLVGRLGVLDKAPVPQGLAEVATELDLVASNKRLGHGLGDALHDLNKIGIFPPEIGVDLLALAALVHAADTRISRSRDSQDSWTREIDISLPVSNVPKWQAASSLLVRMLNFLTGDRWSFSFRCRPEGFEAIAPVRPAQMELPKNHVLSLFSGGLDSLIGAIDLLEQNHVPLLISHAGEGATSDAQSSCFRALDKQYKSAEVKRFRVWMSFAKGLIPDTSAEDSTRGRSFLFFAIGAFAGSGVGGQFQLRAPENGLIALNVPLDLLRLGSLSTRTTHPFYIARWNDLLGALDIDGTVINPYWNRTKGEMVSECRNPTLLGSILPDSLSCSSPTKGRWLGHGTQHCGHCLPCLIRRAAIAAAFGTQPDPTVYTLATMNERILSTRRAEGRQVRSFQVALNRLRAQPGVEKYLIHKAGPLSDVAGDISDLAGVYARGLNEVGAILENVTTSSE